MYISVSIVFVNYNSIVRVNVNADCFNPNIFDY